MHQNRDPGPYDLISGMYRETYCDEIFLRKDGDGGNYAREMIVRDEGLLGRYGAFGHADSACFAQNPGPDEPGKDDLVQRIESLGKYNRNPQFEYDRRIIVRNYSDLDPRSVYKGTLKMKLRQKNLSF